MFLRVAASLLLLALLIPAALWAHLQATHVVTRNALVRSHLSELGVRGEGVVAELYVSAGDTVSKGELLARLEDSHLRAKRAQVTAALATLKERIALERRALEFSRREGLVALRQAEARHRQAQAKAEAAQVRAADASAFYEARQALQSDGAISREMMRDAAAKAARYQSLAKAAAAEEGVALAELEAARLANEALALREAELSVLLTSRREMQAELARVETDIDSMRVLAPANGAIVRRLAQPGTAVNTGTPILSIWLTDDTWIEAWVPEEKMTAVEAGSPVSVSFPALPGERFPGTVAQIGLATDFEMPLDYLPQTREQRMRPTPQVGVQVRLDSAPALLRPGMSAAVDIRRDRNE